MGELLNCSASALSNFVYDPNGRLFQVTINGSTRQFLYDGDALVAEYDTSGNILKRYVHGDQVDEPWVQYNGSGVTLSNRRYLHRDHQGSIIAHSDYAGNIALQPNGTAAKFAYDGFGIPLANNSDSFGYTGQIYFKELGLNYYKARFYSPKLGRFLQTDPIGYKDDMDLYSYVGNDPMNKTDPTGLMEFENCKSTGPGLTYTCGAKSDDTKQNSVKTPPPSPRVAAELQANKGEIPDPNGVLPGGPWEEAKPGNNVRGGTFYGEKVPGGRLQANYVPSGENGGPPTATKAYWKIKTPGVPGWQRYDLQGVPKTEGEVHPNPQSSPTEKTQPLPFILRATLNPYTLGFILLTASPPVEAPTMQ